MDRDINKVRQVLMNELGLTRELVRSMVEEIVKDTVERHITHLEEGGGLDRLIADVFDREYRDPQNGYARFKGLVERAAAEAAKAFVESSVLIAAVEGTKKPEG